MRSQAGISRGMKVIAEKGLAEKIKRGAVPEAEMTVERDFEVGRMGREAMAQVYETLLPRLRRVLPGGASSSSDLGAEVKESC